MEASYVEDRTATLPVGRPASQQRSKSRFVIDDLFITCSRTLFSPTFALLVPATTAIYLNRISITDVWKQYVQGRFRLSWNSFDAVRQLAWDSRLLRWTIWYAGAVCSICEFFIHSLRRRKGIERCISIALLSRFSYAHDQGVGLFSRPKPLVWTEQVVIVTGGKRFHSKLAVRSQRLVWLYR
jgi:hypothetical protein